MNIKYSPLEPLPIFTNLKVTIPSSYFIQSHSFFFLAILQTKICVFKGCQFVKHFAEYNMYTYNHCVINPLSSTP